MNLSDSDLYPALQLMVLSSLLFSAKLTLEACSNFEPQTSLQHCDKDNPSHTSMYGSSIVTSPLQKNIHSASLKMLNSWNQIEIQQALLVMGPRLRVLDFAKCLKSVNG